MYNSAAVVALQFGVFESICTQFLDKNSLVSELPLDHRLSLNFAIVESYCLSQWSSVCVLSEDDSKKILKSVDFLQALVARSVKDDLPNGCVADMQYIATYLDLRPEATNADVIAAEKWIDDQAGMIEYKGLILTLVNCGQHNIIKEIVNDAQARRSLVNEASSALKVVTQGVEFVANVKTNLGDDWAKRHATMIETFLKLVPASPTAESEIETFGRNVELAAVASAGWLTDSTTVLCQIIGCFTDLENMLDTSKRDDLLAKHDELVQIRERIAAFGMHDLQTISARLKVSQLVMTDAVAKRSVTLYASLSAADDNIYVSASLRGAVFARLEEQSDHLEKTVEYYDQVNKLLSDKPALKVVISDPIAKLQATHSFGLSRSTRLAIILSVR